MKALTLWRPWPWAFFYPEPELRKRLENRTRKPPRTVIGQRICLHAGKYYDNAGAEFIARAINLKIGDVLPPLIKMLNRWDDEGLIGTVRIVGWHARGTKEDTLSSIPAGQRRWFIGPYAWICEDERLLAEPIPCKGMQGVWTVHEDIAERIRAQGAA